MSTFDGIPFKVRTQDRSFPNPSFDGENYRYAAEIRVDGYNNYQALHDRVTKATFKTPEGSFASNVHVDAGPGILTLSVPNRLGTLKVYDAVLVSLTDLAGSSSSSLGVFRGSAEWVIVSAVAP